MNNGDGCAMVLVILVFFTIGFATGGYIGNSGTTAYMQNQAVKAEVAHWEINPKTGQSYFVYKTLVKQDSKND